MALSILSTTITFPNWFSIIFWYFFSHLTKSLAIPTNPFNLVIDSIVLSSIYFGLIIFSGKNVTLPKLLSFKYLIDSFAHNSFSTTTYEVVAPKDVVIAREYCSSTSIKFPIVSHIPFILILFKILFTALGNTPLFSILSFILLI